MVMMIMMMSTIIIVMKILMVMMKTFGCQWSTVDLKARSSPLVVLLSKQDLHNAPLKPQSCQGQWWTRSGSCPRHQKHWKSTPWGRSLCWSRMYWWSSLSNGCWRSLFETLGHMDEKRLTLYGKARGHSFATRSRAANKSFSWVVFWKRTCLSRTFWYKKLFHASRALLASTLGLWLESFMRIRYTMPSESAAGCHSLISSSFNLISHS